MHRQALKKSETESQETLAVPQFSAITLLSIIVIITERMMMKTETKMRPEL